MEGSTQTQPARKGMAARLAAQKKLIEKHQAEFDALLKTERESRGLFAKPKRKTREQLEAELAKAQEMLQGHGIDY